VGFTEVLAFLLRPTDSYSIYPFRKSDIYYQRPYPTNPRQSAGERWGVFNLPLGGKQPLPLKEDKTSF